MNKFILTVAFFLLFGSVYALWGKPKSSTYTLHPKTFTEPVTLDAESKLIALFLKESIFIKNERTHCIQKVLFWNLTTGYVNCGHQPMDSVYHTYGNDNLPEKMHFTREELNLPENLK